MLPSPASLLNVPRFQTWYPNQERVVSQLIDWLGSDSRFLCLSAPTGSGKSLTAILVSRLSGRRTVILTATKGLQEQIVNDFACVGAVNVKGQNNFVCALSPELRVDEGPCHEGLSCSYKAQCRYHEQLNRALEARIVVTNYHYYLAQTRFGGGLGPVDLLVMDEADLSFGALESHLEIHLDRRDVGPLGIELPNLAMEWGKWQDWALRNSGKAKASVDDLDARIRDLRSIGSPVSSSMSRSFRTAKSVFAKIANLSIAKGRWVVQKAAHGSGWKFTPVWLDDYSTLLFQETPKVILMSAVMTHKMSDSLGVPADKVWMDVDSSFPSTNTPVWHVPTARINYRTDEYGMAIWMARIDQIIARRLDRKGIIFTVSYKRRDLLFQVSKYADLMFSHGQKDVIEMVRRFKAADPPAILVSPTVTSGWDFPEDDCRYIIVGKIPYPDTQDPVMVARQESDKEWSSFIAMQTLVQEAGRGTRSSADKCEVLIIDDSWTWYWTKYKHYAPAWFQKRVRGSLSSVPDPLV